MDTEIKTKKLTVNDVQVLRFDLEQEILMLISGFEENTDLKVRKLKYLPKNRDGEGEVEVKVDI